MQSRSLSSAEVIETVVGNMICNMKTMTSDDAGSWKLQYDVHLQWPSQLRWTHHAACSDSNLYFM